MPKASRKRAAPKSEAAKKAQRRLEFGNPYRTPVKAGEIERQESSTSVETFATVSDVRSDHDVKWDADVKADHDVEWEADVKAELRHQTAYSTDDELKPIIDDTFLENETTKRDESTSLCSEVPYQNFNPQEYKVFNDPIHGHIQLHPVLVKIIDTPQFQRLRSIKQLGLVYHVYSGASHNRFEHSLGVAHLAGKFGRSLRSNQPDLGITDVEILCLEIAGLCHDLGHGPFSHVYDQIFIPRVDPDQAQWKHEDASLMMFDHLIEDNQLSDLLWKYKICEREKTFIKELILGGPLKGWTSVSGRKDKPYLYEIVANKRTANDVDKWDYFARDCHHLGMKSTFDHDRHIQFARVSTDEKGIKRICCREKEAYALYNMFQSRGNLHRMAYQHKTKQNLENMLVMALMKANDHIKIKGKGGEGKKMSECKDDMEAYTKLTDHIFYQILYSEDPKLAESRQLLSDIEHRKLLRYVGSTQPLGKTKSDGLEDTTVAVQYESEIREKCREVEIEEFGHAVTEWNKILVGNNVCFDYGMGGRNPVEQMAFFSKYDLDKVFYIKEKEVTIMLPANFAEMKFRLFCKSDDSAKITIAGEAMKRWCAAKNWTEPKLFNDVNELLTQKHNDQSSEKSTKDV